MLAARYGGFSLRDSAAIGALMNTRGLTELIVLNIGLDLGVISTQLFTMLVVMALVTTFMAGPILRLIDPRHELSEPVEEELRKARAARDELPVEAPARAILVAPQDEKNLDALLALAEPLAKSTPPRELVVAQLVVPHRFVTGTALDAGEVATTSQRLDEKRAELAERGIASRAVAFTSILPGQDYVQPRLGGGGRSRAARRPAAAARAKAIPRGPVGEVLEKAPCDVAVLVERPGMPAIDAQHPVMVPFGGGDHDWAALELAAWIATAHETPLKLLGAAEAHERRRATRAACSAPPRSSCSSWPGSQTEAVLVDLANDGLLRATEGAGLLVIGLSERWRDEGLGPVRSAIAKAAPAPILFVRRGTRPGALAPRTGDLTKFSWSRA